MQDEEQSASPRSGQSIAMRIAGDAGLPPHPLDKRWFVHVDGQSLGPYTGHEIKQMIDRRQILESDFFCPENGNAWTQAKNEPLLGVLFRSRPHDANGYPQTISAEGGGTIVQVTNQAPNLAAAALLLGGEGAAPKSPGVALLLSFLICGAGQMYNGQVGKGILMLVGFIFLTFVLLFWVVWLWSMIDAYTTAKEMNLRYQQRVLAGLM